MATAATSPVPPGRVRSRVEQVMGTAISIAWRPAGDPGAPAAPGEPTEAESAAVDAAFAWLRRVDDVYSTYKPDSQISRLRDGRATLADCDPDVAEVLARCDRLRADTDGYFDARAGGVLDPSGLVKGWAAERASDLLLAAGLAGHCVNAGGDVRLRGRPAPGRPWRVGIADPHRPGELLTAVEGTDLAVATSGTAERGAHVLDPHTGAPATELAGVTVAGPDLGDADAYATAAVAMGARAVPWLATLAAFDGYEALVVDAAGGTWWTRGFPRLAPGLAAGPAAPGR